MTLPDAIRWLLEDVDLPSCAEIVRRNTIRTFSRAGESGEQSATPGTTAQKSQS